MPAPRENARRNAPGQVPGQAAPEQDEGRAVLSGVTVSSGIALGRCLFINRQDGAKAPRRKIGPEECEAELDRLRRAIADLAQEFSGAKKKIEEESSAGPGSSPTRPLPRPAQQDLLDAYIMICQDPKLFGSAETMIRDRLFCAEWAWEMASQDIIAAFEAMDSAYLRERATDIQAVTSRVLSRLQGKSARIPENSEPLILFAHDLTPADTLALSPQKILALVTEMGGKTSHTGILARSLRIPCVVGCTGLEKSVQDGDFVVVDGISGFVMLNPTESDLADYSQRQDEFEAYDARIRKLAALPAETVDGIRVAVLGNVEKSSDTGILKDLGGEGIGLFRTEFGFLSRSRLPLEDELFDDYRRILEEVSPMRVVLRTLDAGADKMLGQNGHLEEDNPALGLRAIRYCMRHQDIFRRQLRAMLRASVYGNAAIMFPMISGVDELRLAKSILVEVRQELDNEGLPYDRKIPVGSMIELPSAVMVAESLAREVDFFSIGTNDLIQYSLGIDRGNKYVSYLFKPLHPAIIHSIKHVVDMGRQAGISVNVCGEMASDPHCLPLLLGMGIDEISVTPQLIPFIKNLLRRSNVEEYRALLRQVFTLDSPDDILRLVRQKIYSNFQDELIYFASMTGADM